MKAVIVLLAVAAIGAGGWYFMRKDHAGDAQHSAASHAMTAVVEKRDIRFTVSAAGEIAPAEQVSVRPEINGRIDVLPVDIGDQVKKGGLLFSLDDRDLKIERETREKEVERSKLQLNQSEREYLRSQKMVEERLISQEKYETDKTEYELARNALALAEKSLELLEDRLRKAELALKHSHDKALEAEMRAQEMREQFARVSAEKRESEAKLLQSRRAA